MLAIIEKEFRSFFSSMLGYAIIAFYMVVVGIYFYVGNLYLGYSSFETALSQSTFIFIVLVPILTMRSLAEERKNKTDQLLLTSPLSVEKIVIGKYLGVLAVYMVAILISCVYPFILKSFGDVNMGLTFYSIFGFALMGAAYIAIGVFISSLTENQVISAVVTFVVVLLTYLMSSLSDLFPSDNLQAWIIFAVIFAILCIVLYTLTKNLIIVGIVAIIGEAALAILYFVHKSVYDNTIAGLAKWASISEPYSYFTQGIVNAGYILYYVSIVVVCLFLTIQSIKKRRWN